MCIKYALVSADRKCVYFYSVLLLYEKRTHTMKEKQNNRKMI